MRSAPGGFMRRVLTFIHLAIGLALVVLTDCAGEVSIEDRPCPCADGFRCCAATDRCIAEGSVCPTNFVATRPVIARLCASDHGPPLNPPRTGAAYGRFLARRWFVCGYDPASVSGLVANEGIEFDTDGRWFFLKENDGVFERATGPEATGTYGVYSDRLDQIVSPTDTTPGHDLHVRWNYRGSLDLYMEFETSPLRFRTTNGVVLWFVAEGSDGTELIGDEGVSCELDHTLCKPGITCVSEANSEMCARPASNLRKGEGCDDRGTRTCAPPLACSPTTRQCG